MTNSFTGLHAGHYDLVYGDKPYPQEADWVAGELERRLGRQPATLLDVACGSGRHAAEFAARGWEVTGVDYNPRLLELARDAAPGVDFRCQDMRKLDLDGARFDAVTCLFDSIGYPGSDEGVVAALESIHQHLAGVLAIEFLHGPAMLGHAAPVRVRRLATQDGGTLLRVSETRLDETRSTMHVTYELVELRPDGTYERSTEEQSNRFFTVGEMQALLADAGLEALDFLPAYEAGAEIREETFHVMAFAR